jgi:hypothetical protein
LPERCPECGTAIARSVEHFTWLERALAVATLMMSGVVLLCAGFAGLDWLVFHDLHL